MDFIFKGVFCRRKRIKQIVEKAVKATFSDSDVEDYNISFLITNNKQIQKINNEFRSIDKPTDVLSFPSSEEFDGDFDNFYGDIIISLDKVKGQAKEFSQSFDRELTFLTIHGCLHLLGYDHIEKVDEKIMRQKQRQILDMILGEKL